MNGSSSSGGGPGDPSSNGYSGGISSLAYNMVFIVGFIFLILVVSLSAYLCVRANRRAGVPAWIVLRRLDPGSAAAGGGIDEATLRSYPTVLFSSVKAQEKSSLAAGSSDDVGGGSCSICLGEYNDGDVLRLLQECGHLFHVKCVDPWLRLHATCPVCRKSPEAVAIRVDGDSHGGDSLETLLVDQLFGLAMIVVEEIIRKMEIITAGRAFTHLIKIYHEDCHKLIAYAIYRFMRHPEYCGFCIWSIGSQIMLCNCVSTFAFTAVVWHFFATTALYEEFFLETILRAGGWGICSNHPFRGSICEVSSTSQGLGKEFNILDSGNIVRWRPVCSYLDWIGQC